MSACFLAAFYAHGHPEETCQQKLTGARRASSEKINISLLECTRTRKGKKPRKLRVSRIKSHTWTYIRIAMMNGGDFVCSFFILTI